MRRVVVLACSVGCYFEPEPPVITNTAFVTSMTMPATQIRGQDGGDAVCNQAAAGAKLGGTYVAWMSTAEEPATSRLGTARGWYRVDGKPVADRVTDLVDKNIFYPLRIDENGNDVVQSLSKDPTPVATGTRGDGTDGLDCSCFTGTDTDMVLSGMPDSVDDGWTFYSAPLCSEYVRLYCFGVDLDTEVVIAAHEEGKLAFITTGLFKPGPNGRADADALCASEAATARLDGEFLAALAMQTQPLQARFSGGPWVRVDHVEVTTDVTSFVAPLARTATGAFSVTTVWTGAQQIGFPASGPADNCNDWTESGGVGIVGDPGRSDGHSLDQTGNQACDQGRPVYCFQK